MQDLKEFINVSKSLNETYKNKINSISVFSSPIQAISRFGKDVKMPFMIKGRLLTSGTYKDKQMGEITIEPEELKRSMSKWNGIKIYTSHKVFEDLMTGNNPSVRDVVGKITQLEWNEDENAIDFYATIVDEDIARKSSYGLINSISAGFGRDIVQVMSKDNKKINALKNIQPGEASLVYIPRDSNAVFAPI